MPNLRRTKFITQNTQIFQHFFMFQCIASFFLENPSEKAVRQKQAEINLIRANKDPLGGPFPQPTGSSTPKGRGRPVFPDRPLCFFAPALIRLKRKKYPLAAWRDHMIQLISKKSGRQAGWKVQWTEVFWNSFHCLHSRLQSRPLSDQIAQTKLQLLNNPHPSHYSQENLRAPKTVDQKWGHKERNLAAI